MKERHVVTTKVVTTWLFSEEPSRRVATSRTMEIDRIYKINRMRRKKINPVNLVNPVYFLRRGLPKTALGVK
jgi:hypothetical protein